MEADKGVLPEVMRIALGLVITNKPQRSTYNRKNHIIYILKIILEFQLNTDF